MSQPEWSQMKLMEKLKFLISNITVEPILTCYILPNVLANIATQNLNMDKACRVNLAYPRVEVCDAIANRETTNLRDQEVEIQKLVVQMNYWQTIIKNSLPAVLILFLGSFSDRSGRRKPFMLIPIVGDLFTTVGLLLCTYFYYEWPMEVAGFIEAIFPSFTGGVTTMLMAVFSYMGDVTTVSTRTLRLGIVNVFIFMTAPIGTMGSGFLFKAIGYYGVFTTAAIMYAFGIFYGVFLLKESREPTKLTDNFFKELINPKHILETLNVAFKSRKGNLRLRILLIIVLAITLQGPSYGENSVGYMFTRYRFNWNEVQFGIYTTYSIVINLIGTSLAIGIFTQLLKMEDSMLGVLACVSKIIAGIFYAFTSSTGAFYIATLIDLIGSAAVVAMRSIASKLVPSNELGKIFSLFGVVEAIVPIIYQPLYSFVYSSTIKVMPGAFFLVSSSLLMPSMIIFGYLYYLQKKDPIAIFNESNENKPPEAAKTNYGLDITDEQLSTNLDTKL